MSDREEFAKHARHIRTIAEVMLEESFGPRCPDESPGCPTCDRYRLLDELTANPFEEDT